MRATSAALRYSTQLTSTPSRTECVSGDSPANLVQHPGTRIGWSDSQYASKPSASTRWTNWTRSGQSDCGPHATLKRTRPDPSVTHGCVCQVDVIGRLLRSSNGNSPPVAIAFAHLRVSYARSALFLRLKN